jgi:hypothetical protein
VAGGVITIELGEAPLAIETDSDWGKVDSECRSLCRVWQKGRSFASLLEAVRTRRLPGADRWGVLADDRALAPAGAASSADVLALLASYTDEDDPLVLGEINGALTGLANLFLGSREQIAGLTRAFVGGALARWLGTPALMVGDADATAFLGRLWERFREDRSPVYPNLVPLAFRATARHCGRFEELLSLARTDETPEVKSMASIALQYAPLGKLDDVLRIGVAVPLQEVVWHLIGVAINLDSGTKSWDFLRANRGELMKCSR